MRGEIFREWETSEQLQSTRELEETGEEKGGTSFLGFKSNRFDAL